MVENNTVRVLGIDPGSRIFGYGIIEAVQPARLKSTDIIKTGIATGYKYIASGRIELSPKTPLHSRLYEIYQALTDIIREYSPSEAAIEKIFFAKNAQTALALGHARGVSLLAATAEGLAVYEYTALEVKKAVVGYGRAEKKQMQYMTSAILNLKTVPSTDSADALAISICHINTMRVSG